MCENARKIFNTFYFETSCMEMHNFLAVVYNLHMDLMILYRGLLNTHHFLNSCLCCNKSLVDMDPWRKGLSLLMEDSLVCNEISLFNICFFLSLKLLLRGVVAEQLDALLLIPYSWHQAHKAGS